MAELLRKDSPVVVPDNTPSRPLNEWPHADITEAAVSRVEDHRLLEAGEAVGAALGAIVNEAREVPAWLQHRAQQRLASLRRRVQVLRQHGSGAFIEDAAEFTGEAEITIAEITRATRREALHWKFRAQVYARRDPLGFVTTAAVAGFALGFLLRLWEDE